ncbi:hypothetical protein [Aquimarina addita]
MKLITIILFLFTFFGCNITTDNKVTIKKSTIKKDSVNTQNQLWETKSSFNRVNLVGRWENENCNLTFNIFKKNNKYHYKFKSKKREISNYLDIIEEDKVLYLNFKGIEWYENKGELGPEYFEDIPDSLIQKKEETLPTEVSALFENKEMNFVIQNYGNSMNYYTKLEEGCEKYLYFSKSNTKSKDTLNILSDFLSKSIKNHSVIHWKKGDINNDKIDDYIVVLQNEYPNIELTGMDDSYSRIVVLVETLKSYPNFKIASTNNHVLECSNCGGAGVGDPFSGISIKNNFFSIEQLFGACDKSFVVITFKYEKDKWFLHKIGQDNYSCNQANDQGEIEVINKTKTKKDFGLIEFKDYK